MHPRERVSYSAIKDRKPLKLPDGLRLIVWPVLALEEWDMATANMRRTRSLIPRSIFAALDLQIGADATRIFYFFSQV